LSRRRFLGALGAGVVGTGMYPGLARAASAAAPGPASPDDIEHIVVLMQENRSFDEYFGTMSGVIGFEDPNALPNVWKQPGGDRASGVVNTDGYTMPWHMDTKTTKAQSTGGLSHSWDAQHLAWFEGLMSGWMEAQSDQSITMAYFTRDDIPYHFALADHFTVCDQYFCSVLGPTDPNRIVLMSGSTDPEGNNGGPVTDNLDSSKDSLLHWESIAETLQKAGVDWYLFQEGANSDNYTDNPLHYFSGFSADHNSDLYRRGNSFIDIAPGAQRGSGIVSALRRQVLDGTLPQVVYIVGPEETTEHPDSTPGRGAQFIDQVLEALTADMSVWAKTLLILNYDENDGHFDHVVPPTAPPGTAGEYVYTPTSLGPPLPVGLGFRVPCILISPFTKGPLVSHQVFDHTSVIQLLETKFSVKCPNISDWRRSTAGNLLDAINFAATPTADLPALPDADDLAAMAHAETSLPQPWPPSAQVMPTQEKTPARGTPSGPVPPSNLPEVPLPTLLPAVAVAAAAGVYALRTRRERVTEAQSS
jgi:phospholipase C